MAARGLAPGSQAWLRAANQRRVVRAVRDAKGMTQAGIARATGLSAATVSNIVRELRDEGILEVTPTSAGGRRAQAVTLSARSGLLLGADFGHTHLRIVVGNLAHEVLAEDAIPLDVDASADDGLDAAERLAGALLEGLGAGPPRGPSVLGLGVGLPGPIDLATGTLGSSTILPGWVGVNPVAELTRRFGLSVSVDNDANLGALAEATWGAARGCPNTVYVKIGWGVGAGIVIDGEVYRGEAGTAGELGHLTIDESGPLCRCGNRGCLETFAGGRHLADILRPAHGELSTTRIVRLALGGDLACRRVVSDAGRHLGVGVASVCNLLNPGRVIIGGDLAAAGALLFDSVIEGVRRYAVPGVAQQIAVVPGALGERAEALGALALAVRQWERTDAVPADR